MAPRARLGLGPRGSPPRTSGTTCCPHVLQASHLRQSNPEVGQYIEASQARTQPAAFCSKLSDSEMY
jgi:hypothetical protein